MVGNSQKILVFNSTGRNLVDKSSIRVLIVDDYEPWRRYVSTTLRKERGLSVIGEAADGLEAVQQAQVLQPDLILLDIGLPKMNGIEVARQIRKLAPQSKILFVSQESSADIVQQVFDVGAQGYVVKTEAGRELVTAANAVLRNERFVSAIVAGHDLGSTSNFEASNTTATFKDRPHHAVLFYSDDAILLDWLTQFVEVALNAGNAAIVVATESHCDSLLLRLQAHGLDIASAIEGGRYIALDAAATLSTLMLNDTPDPARFGNLLGNLIATAAKATKRQDARVAVFGECVHLLCAQGNTEAAIQVEKVGNQLIKRYKVDIRCAYPLGSLQGERGDPVYQQICAEHSAVFSQ